MPGGFSYLADFKITDSGGEIVSASVGDKALKSTSVDGTSIELDGNNKISIKDSGVSRAMMASTAGAWSTGALTASDAAAGVFQLTNSSGGNLIITRVLIYVTTVASGTCTLDIGQGSGASTSYDNLLDGLDVRSATGIFDNIDDKGTNGEPRQIWTNGQYINASMKTGATSGLVGFYAVHYVNITD